MSTFDADPSPAGSMPAGAGPYIAMRGMHKNYGGIRALRGASLVVPNRGTVHGLIGANGSGKSTLLGIISGQIAPTSGTVEIDGHHVTLHSPGEAVRRGIAMVAQETALTMDQSVTENVLLGGRLVRTWRGIDWSASHARARVELARLRLDIDPRLTVGTLRPDQRQMVEIARALSIGAQILILDEPTSSLPDNRVAALFDAVRELSRQAVTTLFVSHRMNELLTIADTLTVLRDGLTTLETRTANVTVDRVIEAMIGDAEPWQPRKQRQRAEHNEVRLQLDHVCVDAAVRDVTATVSRGEIVGLAGLDGSGRSELLEALFGARRITGGTVAIGGRQVRLGSPRAAIALGIGYVPPERKLQGVHLDLSVGANLELVRTAHRWGFARPDRRGQAALVSAMRRDIGLKVSTAQTMAGTLSGGNQQKVSLGKWLAEKVDLLLLDEPTRGVDVKAKDDIHTLLHEFADRGMSLLVSSSENSELLTLCDRIIVLHRGRPIASLATEDADETILARAAEGDLSWQ